MSAAGSHLAQARRFFAEELAAVYNLSTASLVDAFAEVAREDFLPPEIRTRPRRRAGCMPARSA